MYNYFKNAQEKKFFLSKSNIISQIQIFFQIITEAPLRDKIVMFFSFNKVMSVAVPLSVTIKCIVHRKSSFIRFKRSRGKTFTTGCQLIGVI